MVRTAFALLLVASATAVATADEKLTGPAVIDVKIGEDDKLEPTFGGWNKPAKVSTADELKKLVPDEATRARVLKQVDLKTHDLLVFAWKGSGGDRLSYTILESYPEQVPFALARGLTKDLRSHIVLHAVRKNVRWSAK